jgi:hypothetical protein
MLQTEPDRQNQPAYSEFCWQSGLTWRGTLWVPDFSPINRWDSTRNEDKIAPAHTLLQQCVPMHSRFQTPIDFKNFFMPSLIFAPSSPRHYFFASTLSFSFLHDDKRAKRTNEQTSKRTNGNSPLLTSGSSFAHHYLLFAFSIIPPSFDTRSATTMTTAIGMTTMLVTTPPLLHVAQKGPFKIFKCKKHGQTLAIFF